MVAACLLLAATPAHAAGPVDLVVRVARVDLLGNTPRGVAAAAVAAGVGLSICGTGGGASRQAGSDVAAIVFLPLPPHCDGKGEVVGMSVGPIPVPVAASGQLAAALRPEFGPPCFTGSLPSDGRRRAPSPFTTVWAHGTRFVAVTRETAGSATATVLYADLAPRPERFAAVIGLIEHILPPACHASTGG